MAAFRWGVLTASEVQHHLTAAPVPTVRLGAVAAAAKDLTAMLNRPMAPPCCLRPDIMHAHRITVHMDRQCCVIESESMNLRQSMRHLPPVQGYFNTKKRHHS